MNVELVAVMHAAADPGAPFEVVRDDRHALVLAPAPSAGSVSGLFSGTARRRALASAMVTRQRRLEALLTVGDVLPALPGRRFDRKAAVTALAAAAPVLAEGLARLSGRLQMQVEIALPGTDSGAERDALANDFAALLPEVAEDRLALPHDDEATVANVTLLLPKAAREALERGLERLDAAHRGRPRIRLVGPAPALNFVALDLARPEASAVTGAARRLGLPADATPAAVEAAHRQVARAAHPDAGGRPGADLAALGEARDLLVAVAEARAALAAAGLADAPLPPLGRLRRDGREPIRLARPPREVAA